MLIGENATNDVAYPTSELFLLFFSVTRPIGH